MSHCPVLTLTISMQLFISMEYISFACLLSFSSSSCICFISLSTFAWQEGFSYWQLSSRMANFCHGHQPEIVSLNPLLIKQNKLWILWIKLYSRIINRWFWSYFNFGFAIVKSKNNANKSIRIKTFTIFKSCAVFGENTAELLKYFQTYKSWKWWW